MAKVWPACMEGGRKTECVSLSDLSYLELILSAQGERHLLGGSREKALHSGEQLDERRGRSGRSGLGSKPHTCLFSSICIDFSPKLFSIFFSTSSRGFQWLCFNFDFFPNISPLFHGDMASVSENPMLSC